VRVFKQTINGRVLKYAPECFEVVQSATVPFFLSQKNGTVAHQSTLERISEHAQSVQNGWAIQKRL